MMSMAMGFQPRCGIEDTIIGQRGNRMTSVQQVQQCVRIANELSRWSKKYSVTRNLKQAQQTFPKSDVLMHIAFRDSAGQE